MKTIFLLCSAILGHYATMPMLGADEKGPLQKQWLAPYDEPAQVYERRSWVNQPLAVAPFLANMSKYKLAMNKKMAKMFDENEG